MIAAQGIHVRRCDGDEAVGIGAPDEPAVIGGVSDGILANRTFK
jgi:hypothetical protein